MPLGDDEEIYQEHVSDHYEDPYHRGSCDQVTHAHEDDNPLCGDVVRVELKIDRGRIQEAWFDGDGCRISQAAASMLMERIEDTTVSEVKQFCADEMLQVFGARLTPKQQQCCLLPWRVVHAAVQAPIDAEAESAGPTFSGPDLGAES